MNHVALILGSNLDNRVDLLANARSLIGSEIGEIIKLSSIYESESWGYDSDNSFLNQVLVLETKNTPEETLSYCLSIENKLGRVRLGTKTYSDRSIDIDVLLFNELIISSSSLEIPHPRMHQRRFCLEPLVEIAPDWIIASLQKTSKQVLEECSDNSKITVFHD